MRLSLASCRKASIISLALYACMLLVAVPTQADDLVVKYDQSQLLQLPRPAADVIIGNSSIADVSVQTGNMLVVTGKSFGITNMIALDAERNTISEHRIIVVRDTAKVVNLQKGTKRESYNCSPQCNPSLVIGDDQTYFESTERMAQRKIKFSEGAAEQTAPPQ